MDGMRVGDRSLRARATRGSAKRPASVRSSATQAVPRSVAALATAVAVLLGGVGCVRYRAAPVIAGMAAASLEDRRLDDRGLTAFAGANHVEAWPPEEWDLDALTLAAFYFHPDLDVARARWAVARAGVITVGARPNPTLHLGPVEYVTPTHESSPWIFGFSLDVPVETFGKRGYRIAQARATGESARLGIAAAAWKVRSRLRVALLDLWAAEARSAVVQREQALREEILQMLDRRLALGEADRAEATRERIAVLRVRTSLRDSERHIAEARAHVAGAVGLPIEALDGRKLSRGRFDVLPPPALLGEPTLRRAALVGRADVRAGLAEYEAAEAALQLEVARQYPDLQLGPGYSWEQGASHFAVGLGIALPVLSRNRGPIAEAEAKRAEVGARFTALQAQILAEVDAATQPYEAASRANLAAEATLTSQQEASAQTAARFRAGETDRLELRTAELEVVAAEQAWLDAVLARQQALSALEDALQRPLFGSLQPFPELQRSPRGTGEESP